MVAHFITSNDIVSYPADHFRGLYKLYTSVGDSIEIRCWLDGIWFRQANDGTLHSPWCRMEPAAHFLFLLRTQSDQSTSLRHWTSGRPALLLAADIRWNWVNVYSNLSALLDFINRKRCRFLGIGAYTSIFASPSFFSTTLEPCCPPFNEPYSMPFLSSCSAHIQHIAQQAQGWQFSHAYKRYTITAPQPSFCT